MCFVNKKITYEDSMNIVGKLKFNSDSDLFALERDKGLESIIGNIYQSFAGQDVYNSIEEKSANFLYLIVKNHVFADGNKRIAATMFLYFLDKNNALFNDGEKLIDDHTLVALTIMIAESKPEEKEIMRKCYELNKKAFTLGANA